MKLIALLRGINISGQKLIKMADLRQILTEAGLNEVQTYIQSGNIIFKYDKSKEEAQKTIQDAIKNHYNFDVPTMILNIKELEEIITNTPYKADPESKNPYVVILENEPSEENITKLQEANPKEKFQIICKVIYIMYADGAGKSKLTNNLIESKLKTTATTRNWRTMNKLLSM